MLYKIKDHPQHIQREKIDIRKNNENKTGIRISSVKFEY